MKTSAFAAALLSAGLIACQSADAHHGFGSFDMDTEVEITGTVTNLAWVNPHSWLYLDVAGENGDAAAYRCEMRSATTLRRSGWTPDMFPVGERVTITGSPDKNDPHACYVRTVILDDGSSVDRYGQRTPPVGGSGAPRTPRLANGNPNISGEWAAEQLVMSDPRGVQGSLVPLGQADEQRASEQRAADAPDAADDGRRAGTPLFTSEAAERLFVGRVELTEAGRQAAERARADVNPGLRCGPISILVDWSYDSPVNRITQRDESIDLEYGKFDYRRTVYMDGRPHPAGVEPSLTGHSIGRWDNDVLIVDTVGIEAGPLTRGLVHSDQLHFVERFMLDADTKALKREFVADDPLYFAEPYIGSDTVYPSNVPYQPSPCDDRSLR